MKSFIQKYEKDVMGSLSGFDRLVFRGTLRRLSYAQGMDYFLAFMRVFLKDFGNYVLEVTTRIKEASLMTVLNEYCYIVIKTMVNLIAY